jgi:hypothetical protein
LIEKNNKVDPTYLVNNNLRLQKKPKLEVDFQKKKKKTRMINVKVYCSFR